MKEKRKSVYYSCDDTCGHLTHRDPDEAIMAALDDWDQKLFRVTDAEITVYGFARTHGSTPELPLYEPVEETTVHVADWVMKNAPEWLEDSTDKIDIKAIKAQLELDALRANVTENVATMAVTIKERDAARDELNRLERFVEGLDRVGYQIARREGQPYDRYTCWGESACDVSSKIEKLVKERDRARAEFEARSHLLHATEKVLIAASEERDDLADKLKTSDMSNDKDNISYGAGYGSGDGSSFRGKEASADLTAAAPDLLAACEAAEEWFSVHRVEVVDNIGYAQRRNMLRRAIAVAKGGRSRERR